MTNAGCEAGVDLVTGVVADIDVIVVEDGSTKAIVGNDAIVHMQFGLGSGAFLEQLEILGALSGSTFRYCEGR
uniref:Uncharacterized protein n=1 Tax=Romanomermis culicivorax TaxID=13658 RepID=A0A915HRX3_ROMCU